MRVLYALSYAAGLLGELGGVRRLSESYQSMGSACGLDVGTLGPYDHDSLSSIDLVHIAPASLDMLGLANRLLALGIPYVVSPIVDSLHSDCAMRTTSAVDSLTGHRIRTHLGVVREICQNAAGVCLMSQYESARLHRGLGIRCRCQDVIHPSISLDTQVDGELFRRSYTNSDFVLCVGDLGSTRKNALNLIAAAERARLPLVLVGMLGSSSYGQKVQHAIDRSRNTRYLGIVTRDMLLSAMKACRVFAMPSYLEGLGIAAVEAGALGARVVITKSGAPPEYFGEYAWYVDPNSATSIADGLVSAWNTLDVPPLQKHIQSTLSVDACAPRLIRLYESVLSTRDGKTLEDPSTRENHLSTTSAGAHE